MADNKEQVSARLTQFQTQLSSFLAEGGTLIGGVISAKNSWPAKEGRSASWNLKLSIFGATYSVSVSQKLHDAVRVGDYHLVAVTQRASGGALYSTAVE
jgi:hypothetical protein